ncbi:hypothetical protein FALBO_8315 [Fusarium albosuccineum]|uniref:Uncharacterized protein n=1 Tax=Fusarium albosuccineum TaxID=1237068 RepID=A0A8H4PCZ3_9HYPO|nr:hypothetical protein FALBO_8315 [Fusarium albosuccineum]
MPSRQVQCPRHIFHLARAYPQVNWGPVHTSNGTLWVPDMGFTAFDELLRNEGEHQGDLAALEYFRRSKLDKTDRSAGEADEPLNTDQIDLYEEVYRGRAPVDQDYALSGMGGYQMLGQYEDEWNEVANRLRAASTRSDGTSTLASFSSPNSHTYTNNHPAGDPQPTDSNQRPSPPLGDNQQNSTVFNMAELSSAHEGSHPPGPPTPGQFIPRVPAPTSGPTNKRHRSLPFDVETQKIPRLQGVHGSLKNYGVSEASDPENAFFEGFRSTSVVPSLASPSQSARCSVIESDELEHHPPQERPFQGDMTVSDDTQLADEKKQEPELGQTSLSRTQEEPW